MTAIPARPQVESKIAHAADASDLRFAYLILAHDGFDQLERLIDRLLQGNNDLVYLHIDRKASIPAHFHVPSRVEILSSPVSVYWAHSSQCAAILRLIDAALAGPAHYFHLLSGRDWPLKSREQISQDIVRSGDRDCFINIRPENYDWRMDNWCIEDRFHFLSRTKLPVLWRLGVGIRRFSKRITSLMWRLGLKRSRPLGDWATGWTWWTLPRAAAAHARNALAELLESGRLRFTQCSDEHVIHTAIVNSEYRHRIADNRHFVLWDPGAASPRILTRGDATALGKTGAWFARKFDAQVDDFFYDLVDAASVGLAPKPEADPRE